MRVGNANEMDRETYGQRGTTYGALASGGFYSPFMSEGPALCPVAKEKVQECWW